MVGSIAVAVGVPVAYSCIASALRDAPDKPFAWLAVLICVASVIGVIIQFVNAARG